MVVNLWATWCAPCVAEMPALAALARALAPADIAVMPLSSDRGGADAVRGFYAQHGVSGLPVLLDPKGAVLRAWGVQGIPVTVLIDREGRERARLEGAADWAAPAADRAGAGAGRGVRAGFRAPRKRLAATGRNVRTGEPLPSRS